MKQGNWIPISKSMIKYLPDDRPFTKLEAMVSIEVAYDCNQQVSVSSLSKRWKWSREKVRTFLDNAGLIIRYEGHKYGQKKGQVTLQVADRSDNENRQVVFIDTKGSSKKPDRSDNENRQVTDRSPATISKPKPKPKDKRPSAKKEQFEIFWNVFDDKRGKAGALKSWNKIHFENGLFEEIIKGAKNYAIHRKSLLEKGSTPKMAQGWLTDKRWEDELDISKSTNDNFIDSLLGGENARH